MLSTTLTRWSLAALLIISTRATVASDWPGAPPDCWTASRVVHGWDDYESLWKTNVSVRRVKRSPLAEVVRSPNQGYQFVQRRTAHAATIRIDAEKSYHTKIRIEKVHRLDEVRWINEKLISGRVWWGHIAATDFIFDVEAEAFIWHESATESEIFMGQFHRDCARFGGCTCIQKLPAD